VAEHWYLPNTEIFQSKDVASGQWMYVLLSKAATLSTTTVKITQQN
jgi:hypothetical protein